MVITESLLSSVSAAIQNGIPVTARPYDEIAKDLNCSSDEVIAAITQLQQQKKIKRFGVVVKHRKLGYKSNAMVVWNVDDNDLERIGKLLSNEDAVTLCYQRPRRLPHWPYNLFTMLHGKQREQVLDKLHQIISRLQIESDFDILFSTKCFKQRGANYLDNDLQQFNKENV